MAVDSAPIRANQSVGIAGLLARIDRLPAADRRIVKVVGISAVLILIGLTITGVAVFIEHQADAGWTRAAERGLGLPTEPASTTLEDLHATFGTLGGIVALIGGGLIAIRVLHRVAGVFSTGLVMVVFGAVTGSIIRFNVVERSNGFDASAQGYGQFFGGDVVRVFTDRSEFGSATIAAITSAHVATVPIVIIAGLVTLRRADRDRLIAEDLAAERLRRRQADGRGRS